MAEREVNMRRITKRRLSSLLCAVLMLVTSIDVTAFAAESKASTRKIDVWDMGTSKSATSFELFSVSKAAISSRNIRFSS